MKVHFDFTTVKHQSASLLAKICPDSPKVHEWRTKSFQIDRKHPAPGFFLQNPGNLLYYQSRGLVYMKESKTIQAVPGSGVVWQAFRAAAPQTVPVFAGYLVLGMGYGIYVQSLGLPVWMPMLMGTVVYGGSLEFVLASLLLGAFSPLSAFLMALMIQARHLFYGLAMLERYKGYGLRSFYMIFAMSDETFSITCSAEPPQGIDRGWFMFFITLLDQFYWVASAGLGAVVGSVLPFSTKGVDFVMTAMFVVIFLNQWEKEKQHYSGIIGLAVPLVCLVLFGSGSFLLPSMACILVLLLVLRKPIERANGIVPGQTEKQKEAAQ
ncbi:autotransporter [Faecalibacterium duncaniae]|uniref:Azaleucine resistance protein AzlC n=2 Tax=Faecalibacterium duncaniae (strain DSM 17677 / JCM 31915 / A2-165) TaxID=411483 RepID=C7H8V9_FAED2|nr:autotransporter [Faecalibacterium duncaniae]EEU95814.1 putative azaleucine resistance protein AzlC [Faecalibacterium duncaniae]